MGIVTSRFRGKKSTVEVLEAIEKDIAYLQKCRRQNQELQKRTAASILLYSILAYILALPVFYFFYLPDTWQKRAVYSIPFFIFPFIIWVARKVLHWYFFKRLASNDLAVNELYEKKKLILEDVMEKETYKKAREILEKFDPARFKKLEAAATPVSGKGTPGTSVRQRVIFQPATPGVMNQRAVSPATVPHAPAMAAAAAIRANTPSAMVTPFRYNQPPGPPMPRSVLPRERGSMDKFIDLLVGDGPQNRFALICHHCKSHNGMALPEEFEYLSFRCCYCFNINPARKQRPFAPRLEFPEVSPQAISEEPVSEDESESEADGDANKNGKKCDMEEKSESIPEVEKGAAENADVDQHLAPSTAVDKEDSMEIDDSQADLGGQAEQALPPICSQSSMHMQK